MSINGAACATLFSYAIYFVCLLLFIGCRLRVNIISGKQFVVFCLILVLFALNYVWSWLVTPLMGGNLLVESVVKTLVFVILAAVGLYVWNVSPIVNTTLKNLLASLRNHKLHNGKHKGE